MLKTKLAGIVAAAVLLSAGAANATQGFPSSVNESKPFSFPYEGMRDVRSGAGAARASAPAMPSESMEHSVPARSANHSTMADRLSRTYGIFPSSVNESGPL